MKAFDSLKSVFKSEAGAGILLFVAAVAALIFANVPGLAQFYNLLLETPLSIQVSALLIAKPLLLWVNDGLMALFFLLVGLELKREFLTGELRDFRNVLLPGIGAVGGMVVPALVYLFFNSDDPVARQGWAIPAATDIAFALGVLALLGSRVPASVKVFLTSLAIFDDVGAIIIIALFYTSSISNTALIVAACCIAILFVLNRLHVCEKVPYVLVGLVMWVALLKSGVHATLAGVVLAMFIPIAGRGPNDASPLRSLEHELHGSVNYVILPIFAFCNAGLALHGVGWAQLTHPVPLGIAAGLFIGKQVGVFLFCMLFVWLGVLRLPKGMTARTLYGVAALCGVGFTMSLFIGSLAFQEVGVGSVFDERLGILVGSLISGILGYCILHWTLPRVAPASKATDRQIW